MKANMGSIDRIVRFIIGTVLIVLFAMGKIEGTLGIILTVLGGVFILTALISFCPLYLPFGISTCRQKEVKQ